MRTISDSFYHEMINEDGILHPIIERLRNDDTLMFAIRNGYFNIYYRGGSIAKVKENKLKKHFIISFDKEYNKTGISIPHFPEILASKKDTQNFIGVLPLLKEIMDTYFSKKNKYEREFQQVIARENNSSPISNGTEYFITDIEFAVSEIKSRFDMLAIQWLSSDRSKAARCRPVFIEVKYGDEALSGKSGLTEHLKKIEEFISSKNAYSESLAMMADQFRILDELQLMKFNKSKNELTIDLCSNAEKPQVIFIFANHNPRSRKLREIIENEVPESYENPENFDLRFFVSTFAGYGMHEASMLKRSAFLQLLQSYRPKER
ncbi:hypothetical protein [Desulfonatronum sp. SC1]|uniref:hypothetical protein n=1 Tax=Desulfonatronum sp. SC1 TaxID=2109626 RepID=UPI000D313C03|nr:hypothetical protein [Desulfonatronum sp. SC1]PTN37063.1 hypothetical protein C6366_08155 [Desulfonatronum sp. SC1]